MERDRDTEDGGRKGEIASKPTEIDAIVKRAWKTIHDGMSGCIDTAVEEYLNKYRRYVRKATPAQTKRLTGKRVQETLKKHPDHLDPKKAKDQLHLSILEDKDDISLLSAKEFKEKFDALIDVKKAIDSISIAEITEQDKQLEIQNNDFHMNEEYDAVQTMHLFALLHQHENQVR